MESAQGTIVVDAALPFYVMRVNVPGAPEIAQIRA
jgi:hypothetical protein